ncbi:TPA: hypothetical protein RRI82_004535 [Klebsiella pneumoniae]|nr:hypothetical protein [Klebsiella pneumoniae]
MAVTGPNVGSSAKAVTGESSMIAAGAKLRLGTPFWMSSMIGKSVFHLIFRINYATGSSGDPSRYRGFFKRGLAVRVGDSANQPTLNAFPGGDVGSLVAITNIKGDPYCLSIWNGQDRRVKVSIFRSDGAEQYDVYFSGTTMADGWRRYKCEDVGGLNGYFEARMGNQFGALLEYV